MVALLSVAIVAPAVAFAPVALVPGTPASAAPAGPAPVMLILDASGSMKESAGGVAKMTEAKQAVRTLVEQAPDGARLGLTVYGTGTGSAASERAAGCQDVTVVRPVAPVDRAGLTAAVDAVNPRGYTPIGKALQVAAAALPAQGPRSIVLVSDGIDTCAPPDPCEVARQLASRGVDLRVHAVGFDVDSAARRQLTCIAQATGGTYSDAQDARSLSTALNRVTAGAPRNYQATGTPIAGTEQEDRAPALKPGSYLDHLDPDGAKYYTVDVPAGDTLYVTATLSHPTAALNGVLLVGRFLAGAAGAECDHENQTAIGLQPVITTPYVWQAPQASQPVNRPCDKAGRQDIRVWFDSTKQGQPTASLELLVTLEPPVTDPGPEAGAQVQFTAPGGQPKPVVGGGSFGTASTLDGTGSYADTIRPGELIYYKVRVGWGQGLASRIRIADDPSFQKGTNYPASTAANWYNPMRVVLDNSVGSWEGRAVQLPGDAPAFTGRRIRYRNREQSLAAEDLGQSMAGWYYISIYYVRSLDLFGKDRELSISITVDVSLVGDAEPGPKYAGVSGSGPSGAGSPVAGRNALGGSGSPGLLSRVSSTSPLVWVGVPLLLVLLAAAGLATAILIRRRRRAAPSTAATYQPAPPPGARWPAPPAYPPAPPAYRPAPPAYPPAPPGGASRPGPAPPAYRPAPPAYPPAPPGYQPPPGNQPRPPAYQPAPPEYRPRHDGGSEG
jgi:Ca-activated chloride channel homolog